MTKIAFSKNSLVHLLRKYKGLPFSRIFASVTLTLMVAGCASEYKADPNLIQGFKEPKVPAGKTGLYVIRGENFQGGARSVWVAVNDKVVAALPNGSNVYLELDSGLNTLSFVQAIAGHGYLAVDNKPGEILYAKFGYATTGLTELIDKGLGKTMVMQTKAVEPLKEKKENTAYGNQLINPGLLQYPIMTASTNELTADDSHAVIRFYRPGELISKVAFDVWNQDGYVGSLKGETYFSVKLKPGHHVFISKSERYAVLDAQLEANKEYAVQLDVGMGWAQAHIKLLPVDLSTEAGARQVQDWKKNLKSTQLDQAVVESDAIAPRIKLGYAYLESERTAIANNEDPKRTLPATFGK